MHHKCCVHPPFVMCLSCVHLPMIMLCLSYVHPPLIMLCLSCIRLPMTMSGISSTTSMNIHFICKCTCISTGKMYNKSFYCQVQNKTLEKAEDVNKNDKHNTENSKDEQHGPLLIKTRGGYPHELLNIFVTIEKQKKKKEKQISNFIACIHQYTSSSHVL